MAGTRDKVVRVASQRAASVDSTPAVGDGDSGRLLVPRTAGPLVAVDAPVVTRRDEIDQIVRELFGDSDDESPGRLDAILLIVGAAMIAWSLLGGASTGVLVLGVFVLLLGAVLPLRSARRRLRRARAEQRKQHVLGQGQVLDASHPAVRSLAASYQGLAAASALPGVTHGDDALRAGHMAVTEVASLLDGRSPSVDAEIDYITRRVTAIDELAEGLRHRHEEWLARDRARLAQLSAEERLAASAKAIAREQVAALDPEDSLDELERQKRLLERQ